MKNVFVIVSRGLAFVALVAIAEHKEPSALKLSMSSLEACAIMFVVWSILVGGTLHWLRYWRRRLQPAVIQLTRFLRVWLTLNSYSRAIGMLIAAIVVATGASMQIGAIFGLPQASSGVLAVITGVFVILLEDVITRVRVEKRLQEDS